MTAGHVRPVRWASTARQSVRQRQPLVMEAEAPQQPGWGRAALSLAALAGTGVLLHHTFNKPATTGFHDTLVTLPGELTHDPAGVITNLARDRTGAYAPVVREHLHATYAHVAGGLTVTAGMVAALHRSGLTHRLMRLHPLAVVGVSLVTSIGAMTVARHAEPGPGKYAAWAAFHAAMAASLAPLPLLYAPVLLTRAGVYTLGLVGGISVVGLTAQRDQYLWLGAPLMGGLGVVCVASLANVVLARSVLAGTASKLAATAFTAGENISLYGGLAVFSGLVLYDTQKIVTRAEAAVAAGQPLPPAVDESIGLYLDIVNIFTRMLQILARGSDTGRKRRK